MTDMPVNVERWPKCERCGKWCPPTREDYPWFGSLAARKVCVCDWESKV